MLTRNITGNIESKLVDTANHPGIRVGSESFNSEDLGGQKKGDKIVIGAPEKDKKKGGCCGGKK